jgi:DNA polymerase I-like protein with 3'-5' exonuclease and polymerase domains
MLHVVVQPWQKLLANAAVVYQYLEDVGIRDNYRRVPLRYSLETYTGRSKTLMFNLQGASDQYDIRSIHDGHNCQIHLDWIAADLRVAAFLSDDKIMNDAYCTSDPYILIQQMLGDKTITRDQCKMMLLRAIYSLAIDEPILELFPTFKGWMRIKLNQLHQGKILYSMMGRSFPISSDRDELSVFNSQFQGSVVHIMQAALIKLFKIYRTNLLAEIHDSIVLSCPVEEVSHILREAIPIMLDPLKGWIDPSPRMPLMVRIGHRWKHWQEYRTFR